MVAPVVRAETGALAIGYDAVAETKGSIDARLQLIRDELVDLGQGWLGDAATAFQALMTEFDTSATNLQGVLITLEGNLRTIAGIHVTTEDEVTDVTRSAPGGDMVF
ncbi:MAG: WXG100 family type VII secretion target [Micrococcales bacterium]|nr:WXG100 family type VII secretion target [Micrococcales bacterium]